MKSSFNCLTLLAIISSATALPAWIGNDPLSSQSAGQPSYQNSSAPIESSTAASTTSVSSGVYTLPYTTHATTTHSFVYESTLYGPKAPHTHVAFSIPKIYSDPTPAVSTA